MKKNRMNISERLRSLRNIHRITVGNLAEGPGISLNNLTKYETDFNMPSMPNIITISRYFGISIDFLLAWDKTPFPRSLKMVDLAGKIDKTDEYKKFQIIATANTLIGSRREDSQIKQDDLSLQLTDSLHENLKAVREKKGLSQIQVSTDLKLNQARISLYEKDQTPKAQTLIRLSGYYGTSIHALVTGQKLHYSFKNGDLLEVIMKADRLLSLDDKETVIKIMARMIENMQA